MTYNNKFIVITQHNFHIAIRFLVTLGLLMSISLAPSGAPAAHAQEKRITVELYPGADKINPVVLSFNGIVYVDPSLPELNENAKLPEDERFMAKAIAVNGKGALDEVLALWTPSEREETRSIASDPRIFEANRKLFSNIEQSFLKAKIYYGTYIIFIVKHVDRVSGGRFKAYPVKKVQGEYFFTNTLREDPVFQYLSTKYINKLQGR